MVGVAISIYSHSWRPTKPRAALSGHWRIVSLKFAALTSVMIYMPSRRAPFTKKHSSRAAVCRSIKERKTCARHHTLLNHIISDQANFCYKQTDRFVYSWEIIVILNLLRYCVKVLAVNKRGLHCWRNRVLKLTTCLENLSYCESCFVYKSYKLLSQKPNRGVVLWE